MPETVNENTLGAGAVKPRVSIVIPLYNHEKFIEEAVQSVLGQSYEDFEVIIINDGSTDGSGEVVKGIGDKRIKYFSQDNRGAAETINRGIQLARGEFISVLNSDDIYDTHRLEECAGILDNDASLSAVFSHLEFIDGEGKFIKYLRGSEENWADHFPETSFKGERNIVLDLLAGNFLTTTSNLFCRREAFETVGYFSNLRYAHDYEFFLRLCYHQRVQIIEAPLVKYRIHSLNTVKENEPAVSFEVGLVLANFFLNYDLQKVIGAADQKYDAMLRFYKSVKTHGADRLIMTLLLFGTIYAGEKNEFLASLSSNSGDIFRRTSIDHFRREIDSWQTSQRLWDVIHKMEDKLGETERKLVETSDEAKKWWINSQDAWQKVEDAGRRLAENEQKLAETAEEAKKWWMSSEEAHRKLFETENKLLEAEDSLKEITEELQSLTNSAPFRLWRALARLFRRPK